MASLFMIRNCKREERVCKKVMALFGEIKMVPSNLLQCLYSERTGGLYTVLLPPCGALG